MTTKTARPTKTELLQYAMSCANADVQGDVYIIAFSRPIGNTANVKGSAQFYTGWAKKGEALRRFNEHRTGRGARITAAAMQKGIEMYLVAVIPGTVVTERKIKNLGNTRGYLAKLVKQGLALPIAENFI